MPARPPASAWRIASAARAERVAAVDGGGQGAVGEALDLLVGGMRECVDAGASDSTDAPTDAVALWLGLHGLAHQRTAALGFPWPTGIADRLVTSLAHLARSV